jgi:hypothetical protein
VTYEASVIIDCGKCDHRPSVARALAAVAFSPPEVLFEVCLVGDVLDRHRECGLLWQSAFPVRHNETPRAWRYFFVQSATVAAAPGTYSAMLRDLGRGEEVAASAYRLPPEELESQLDPLRLTLTPAQRAALLRRPLYTREVEGNDQDTIVLARRLPLTRCRRYVSEAQAYQLRKP